VIEEHSEYWPTSAWRNADPQTLGINPTDLLPLRQSAQEDERIHSLLLARSGYIVFEEYYHGWSANKYHNVNSITKSVTSALVGIALREKLISALDQSIFTFFPEYASLGEQENRKAIHLHHLLSLTSGFQFLGDIDTGGVDTFLEHTVSVENILRRSVVHEPGQVFSYDDLDVHLLSLILTRVTGMSTANFAHTMLFEPLGIWRDEEGRPFPWKHGLASADAPHPWGLWNEQDDLLWSVDRHGQTIGAFGLQLTTRELAKLGHLYLRQGKWDGQQIIPAEYVQASLRPYSQTGRGTDYGYCWYLPPDRRPGTFLAIGFGGQFLACFPDLDLIFAMTAYPDPNKPAAHDETLKRGLWPLLANIQSS